jgi:hypothetical protein
MDYEEELMDNSLVVRGLGVLCLLLGGFLGYLGVYQPIQQAHAGADSISLRTGVAGAAAAALLCGVIFLIAGRSVKYILVLKWQTARPMQIIGTLTLVAICLGVEIVFERYLESLGYFFR